jgi:hypothetical protein
LTKIRLLCSSIIKLTKRKMKNLLMFLGLFLAISVTTVSCGGEATDAKTEEGADSKDSTDCKKECTKDGKCCKGDSTKCTKTCDKAGKCADKCGAEGKCADKCGAEGKCADKCGEGKCGEEGKSGEGAAATDSTAKCGEAEGAEKCGH